MTFNPQPKQGAKPKKEKKPLKRTAIKKKFKATGEAQLFEEIAEEREWICFVTNATLFMLTPTSFMHVLPKALNKYPKFKLYKKNIVLSADDIHYKWDFTLRSELKKDPRFDKLFALEAELKEEYKNITKL